MDEEGYEFDEEIFLNNCPNYDNDALKNFSEMFKTLKPHSKHGFRFVIGAGQPQGEYYSQPKATFEDYINRKKN